MPNDETSDIARCLDLWWQERQQAAQAREAEMLEIEELLRRAVEARAWEEATMKWEKY